MSPYSTAHASRQTRADKAVRRLVTMISLISCASCFHKFSGLPTCRTLGMIGHLDARERKPMLTIRLSGLVCAATLMLAGTATAQEGSKAIQKTTIVLGTATPGGGFPLFGNAFAEVMNAADQSLAIEPRNTKGSNENIPLLEAGKLDIALVAGEPAYQAFMGIGRPKTNIKILTAIYSSPGMFVVRADSPYE